jgi:Holliday junction resolvase
VIPTEYQEQVNLIQYLELKGYPYFRVPNETHTHSWNQKRINRALGVKSGVPDLFVIVNNRLIAIEMKRQKGSKTTPEQIEWIKRLNDCAVPARICRGAGPAIEFVEEMSECP